MGNPQVRGAWVTPSQGEDRARLTAQETNHLQGDCSSTGRAAPSRTEGQGSLHILPSALAPQGLDPRGWGGRVLDLPLQMLGRSE